MKLKRQYPARGGFAGLFIDQVDRHMPIENLNQMIPPGDDNVVIPLPLIFDCLADLCLRLGFGGFLFAIRGDVQFLTPIHEDAPTAFFV